MRRLVLAAVILCLCHVGALAQTNRAQLRDRSDGLRAIRTNQVHAGHERGGHRAHAAREYAEPSLWRCYGRGPAHEFVSPWSYDSQLPREMGGDATSRPSWRPPGSAQRAGKVNIMRKARPKCNDTSIFVDFRGAGAAPPRDAALPWNHFVRVSLRCIKAATREI